MNEAEAIVRALAALSPEREFDRRNTAQCLFCSADRSLIILHRRECVWDQARTWVEANPKEEHGSEQAEVSR